MSDRVEIKKVYFCPYCGVEIVQANFSCLAATEKHKGSHLHKYTLLITCHKCERSSEVSANWNDLNSREQAAAAADKQFERALKGIENAGK